MLARSKSLVASLAFTSLVLTATNCSLTVTTVDECKKTEDCRKSFAVGRVCGAEGFCERAPPAPRCAQAFPADVITRFQNYPNVILVGSLMDRSIAGQVAREEAIQLATKQVNEQGGLNGRLFGTILCDIAENPQYDSSKRTDAAVASARYLADVIGTTVILGPSSSTDAIAVFKAVKDKGVVVISPSATSPALTAEDPVPASDDVPGQLWRTAAPDTLQGVAIARHLREALPAVNRVALIQEKGAYGDALAGIFTTAFQQAGGTVEPLAFTSGNTAERDQAIVEAGAKAAKVVLFVSSQSTDSETFLKAVAGSESYKGVDNVFLTDAAASATVFKNAKPALAVFPRVMGSRPAVPKGPTFELFQTSYKLAFGGKDPATLSFVPHAYDASWMAFYGTAFAIGRDGRVSGRAVARGLRKISDGSPETPITPANWKKIADALAGGGSVNVVGASGVLDYDAATEETSSLINIWKIVGEETIESIKDIDPR